jgi:hypothetical protein
MEDNDGDKLKIIHKLGRTTGASVWLAAKLPEDTRCDVAHFDKVVVQQNFSQKPSG